MRSERGSVRSLAQVLEVNVGYDDDIGWMLSKGQGARISNEWNGTK